MIGSPQDWSACVVPTALSTGINSFRDRSRLLPPVFRHQSEEKGCESKPADQAQTEYLGTVERGQIRRNDRDGSGWLRCPEKVGGHHQSKPCETP